MPLFAPLLISLALAQAAAPAAPAATPTLSRAEVGTLAPEAVVRRLFGESATGLLPFWAAGATQPDTPLDMLTFRSAGRSAGFAGLCVSDQIYVRFEPAGPVQGAATVMRPRRTASVAVYYRADERSGPAAAVTPETRAAEDMACHAIDPRRTHVFVAPDPERLARTIAILSRAVAAAQQGRDAAALDCAATAWEGHAALDPAQCRALMAMVEIERVFRVGECPDGDAWSCTIVEISLDPNGGPIDWIALRVEYGDSGEAPTRLAVGRIAPQLVP